MRDGNRIDICKESTPFYHEQDYYATDNYQNHCFLSVLLHSTPDEKLNEIQNLFGK